MSSSSDRQTIRLWGFIDPDQLAYLNECAGRKCRVMNAGFALRDETPVWASKFPGSPIVIGENYGEYDGPFGAWRDAVHFHLIGGAFDFVRQNAASVTGLVSAQERRAQESRNRKLNIERNGHLNGQTVVGVRAAGAIDVIKRFTSVSPITLLLDAGGVLKSSFWGNATEGEHLASWDGESVQSLHARDLTIEFVLSFPYWKPTIIHG